MSILVIGGTGMVGRHVVQGLLAKGAQLHVLTRSADKADLLPLGASGIIGDLRKPETLRCAMKGIDRVFLITPPSTSSFNAMGSGRAKRILSCRRRYSAIFPAASTDALCVIGNSARAWKEDTLNGR